MYKFLKGKLNYNCRRTCPKLHLQGSYLMKYEVGQRKKFPSFSRNI